MAHRLIDIVALKSLFEDFSGATGMATAILDLEGNVLAASGWQDICTRFHRADPRSAARCRESDARQESRMEAGRGYSLHRCRNGLVDVAVPIIGVLGIGRDVTESSRAAFPFKVTTP